MAPQAFLSIFLLFFLGLVFFFSFFWVGGVPLAVFSPPPCLFLGSGRLGWGFLLSLASCFFLSLAARETWSSDPLPPRPSLPLVLARPASPISCWELSVGRAEAKGCGVTGGL